MEVCFEIRCFFINQKTHREQFHQLLVSEQTITVTPEYNYIKDCYINARSLRNIFEDLKTLAVMNHYYIIGVANKGKLKELYLFNLTEQRI